MLSCICQALQNNEVFTTDKPEEIGFTYEVAVSQEFVVVDIVENIDEKLQQLVGNAMINCNNLEQRTKILQQSREVHGVDSYPRDEVTEEHCSYFTQEDRTLPENTECSAVHGLLTLYLSSTGDGSIREKVQALLGDSINNEGSQFTELIEGLEAVHYD